MRFFVYIYSIFPFSPRRIYHINPHVMHEKEEWNDEREMEKLFSVTNVEVIKVFVVLAHKIVLIHSRCNKRSIIILKYVSV